jgi:lipoate-protein ligase A
MTLWRFLLDKPGAPAWNMAVDEALLRQVQAPVLRLYHWKGAAQSIGYFQKWTEARPGIPFVRRYTGGGLVDHAQDVTYTIVLPAGHKWAAMSTQESYELVHWGLQVILNRIGLNAEMAPCCDPVESGECFSKAVKFDLKVEGKKVAGAAQRRTKNGFLHQGSILLPDAQMNRELVRVFPQAMGEVLKFEWKRDELTALECEMAFELEKSRYSQKSWNERV